MKGYPIMVGDVLKMYHFTGARRKKHYMYKWVIEKNGRLFGHHLGNRGDADAFMLHQEQLKDTEIVQGFGHFGEIFSDRPKVKVVE
jgi:IS1 family transposase